MPSCLYTIVTSYTTDLFGRRKLIKIEQTEGSFVHGDKKSVVFEFTIVFWVQPNLLGNQIATFIRVKGRTHIRREF